MTLHPIPANEKARLNELFTYQIIDSPVDTEFENIVGIVTKTFNVPVAAISLVSGWCRSILPNKTKSCIFKA